MKTRNKLKVSIVLILVVISLTGCFRIMEAWLGVPDAPVIKTTVVETVIVRSSAVEVKVAVVRDAPGAHDDYSWYYVGYYNLSPPPYRYPTLLCQWWYNKGQRHWWRDNIDPMFRSEPEPVYAIERGSMIPRAPKAGIDRYVDHGVPTGSFLRAVLSNDLFEAVTRADLDNQLALVDICAYIRHYTPATCHGSPEEVEAWLKFHREEPMVANEAASQDRERRAYYYK